MLKIIMNVFKQVYDDIESENDNNVKKLNKVALYTLVNYLEAKESISSLEIQAHFLNRKEFSKTFQKLVDSSIIEQSSENGNFKLNSKIKTYLSPLLQELTSMVHTSKDRENLTPSKRDPTLELLYNCRSQMFSY